jgi:serine/threonine protein kinase
MVLYSNITQRHASSTTTTTTTTTTPTTQSLEHQPNNMSSGNLPLATYHRAQSLGSGSYGSVITVYDDDGQEFALKLFEEDDDDDEVGMPLGALREISVLRLLRDQNEHPNIIAMHDVQTGFYDDGEEGGAGTEGYLAMVRKSICF